MKVKSSNKSSFFLLLGLSLLVVLLVVFSGEKFDVSESSNKKGSKEVSFTKQNTTLNFIEITISEKSYNKLNKYKNRALSVGVISAKDKKYVPATITFNGKKYKADVRLKGDWIDHLEGDKWSFRIKLKGDKTILGMRKFSIHHPKTRGYINEWIFQKATKAENLIGLRYDFVEGALHIKKADDSGFINKSLGIYAIEETFDKRMLENNGRKESVIIKFSEAYWWANVKKRIEAGKESGIKWDRFNANSKPWDTPITVFSESKVLENDLMHNHFKMSKSILLDLKNEKLKLKEVFNVKQIAMHIALVNLFGAIHGEYIINHRFYYNPITSKLEPISFDGNSGQKIDKLRHFRFINKTDTIYFKELIKALEKVSKKEYLDHLLVTNKNQIDYNQGFIQKEFLYSEMKLKSFKNNQEVIIKELDYLKTKFNVKEESIKEELKTPDINSSKWKFNNSELIPTNKKYKDFEVYKLSRIDTSKSSYTFTNFITQDFKERYSINFLVKKTSKSDLFAIRIQEDYPNRVDAIFDLSKGEVVGIKKIGAATGEKASIKKMDNGWYLCTLSLKPHLNTFQVIIGAAKEPHNILDWESKSVINNEILIALKPE